MGRHGMNSSINFQINPHLTVKTIKKSLDFGVVTPSKPDSPKTPNPPTQTISLSEQKTKKIVDSSSTSSRKKIEKSY
jgi:hypothetical protein